MAERYKLIDKIAHYAARFIPPVKPNTYNMKDYDFITVLSWCEKWDAKKVYYTAYKEARLDFIETWDEWCENMKPLPIPVRAELERALWIHHNAGNLGALRTYAWINEYGSRILLWSFFGIVFYMWFLA